MTVRFILLVLYLLACQCAKFDAAGGYGGFLLLGSDGSGGTVEESASISGSLLQGAPTDTSLAEGGASISFTLTPDRAPASDVFVSLDFDDAEIMVDGAPSPLLVTFTPAMGTGARTLTVLAVDDGVPEGPATETVSISFLVSSSDKSFDGRHPGNMSFTLADNDHSLRVFVTDAAFNGDFTAADPDWRVAADARCMADVNRPMTGNYKALMAGGSGATLRRACENPLCAPAASPPPDNVDWVLQPNRDYVRVDATPLFSTDARAIVDLFALGNLTNSVTGSATDRYWTGLDGAWEPSILNCGNWSDDGAMTLGIYGRGEVTDTEWIETIIIPGDALCSQVRRILCVEQ